MASTIHAICILICFLVHNTYGAASCSERDQAFCTANSANCKRSRYIQTVCPMTCGKCSAPSTAVCLTGPPGSEICSVSTPCAITHHCYFGSCCPLPICNDGVTRAKQICGVQNVCPRGFSCQNSACCPTGLSATRAPVAAASNQRSLHSAPNSGSNYPWGKCYLASQRSASSFSPRCTPMGHYKIKQCVGPQCFCVNPDDGARISTMGVSDCSDRGCALKVAEALELAHSRSVVSPNIPACTREGHFELKQCNPVTGYCWCVDSSTGRKVAGSDKHRNEGQPRCSR